MNFENVYFQGEEHKERIDKALDKVKVLKKGDIAKFVLFYILASNVLYEHLEECYDFEDDCIKPECLNAGWQSSGSLALTRLAFNLFTSRIVEENANNYAVDNIFAPLDRDNTLLAVQAIKLKNRVID